MDTIPIYDATTPITCTAAKDEIPKRIEQVERIRSGMTLIERTRDGVLLHFAPSAETEADVRQFTIDEKGCCQFWGFEVRSTSDDLTLRWDGPPDVSGFMDRLHAWFISDDPLTADSGLL